MDKVSYANLGRPNTPRRRSCMSLATLPSPPTQLHWSLLTSSIPHDVLQQPTSTPTQKALIYKRSNHQAFKVHITCFFCNPWGADISCAMFSKTSPLPEPFPITSYPSRWLATIALHLTIIDRLQNKVIVAPWSASPCFSVLSIVIMATWMSALSQISHDTSISSFWCGERMATARYPAADWQYHFLIFNAGAAYSC